MTITDVYKTTIGYTLSDNGESSSRTVSGLNVWVSNNTGLGPSFVNATTNLVNTIMSLTNGTMSNVRFIQERAVEL